MKAPMKRRALTMTACALAAGCSLLGGPSKVRSGELFETGEQKYDAYFKDVHELQIAAVGWADEQKASCRPLVDALKLQPDAADVSIVQATHERVATIARDVGPTKLETANDDVHLTATNAAKVDEVTRELFKAIETCAHAQMARAKGMREVPTRVDDLSKTGRALEPHVREDFAKRGGRAAMDVQQELTASYEVLGDVSKSSRNGAREAEDFVATLQRAVDSDAPAAEPARDAGEPKLPPAKVGKSKPSAKPPAEPRAAADPPPRPKPPAEPETRSDPDPPKPKPKPKPADEPFNP